MDYFTDGKLFFDYLQQLQIKPLILFEVRFVTMLLFRGAVLKLPKMWAWLLMIFCGFLQRYCGHIIKCVSVLFAGA